MEIPKIIYQVIIFGSFLSSVLLTARALYVMFWVVTNVTGRFALLLGPFLLFMPGMFNEKGDFYRGKLVRILPWLLFSYLILFGFSALAGLFNKAS